MDKARVSFVFVIVAFLYYLWSCVFPMVFKLLGDWNGVSLIGFHSNAMMAFMGFAIIFYSIISWMQRRYKTAIAVAIYSMIFSIGF